MLSILLEQIKDQFDTTELESSRLDLDVFQAESLLHRCEKYSWSYWQRSEVLKALKEKQKLTRTKLASLAMDLYNEKTRIGL